MNRKTFFRRCASLLFTLSCVILSSPSLLAGEMKRFNIDSSHTKVEFKIAHLVISTVTGRYNQFGGQFAFDPETMRLVNVQVNIEAASIDTNEPDRDKHLRSEDFFHVAKYPQIKFSGKKIHYTQDKKIRAISGDLTIRSVTKPVFFQLAYNGFAVDPWGNERIAFSATTQIERKDFGITWNKKLDKGGFMIGDKVTLTIEGEGLAVVDKQIGKQP